LWDSILNGSFPDSPSKLWLSTLFVRIYIPNDPSNTGQVLGNVPSVIPHAANRRTIETVEIYEPADVFQLS
jgi:hypothetical protein